MYDIYINVNTYFVCVCVCMCVLSLKQPSHETLIPRLGVNCLCTLPLFWGYSFNYSKEK